MRRLATSGALTVGLIIAVLSSAHAGFVPTSATRILDTATIVTGGTVILPDSNITSNAFGGFNHTIISERINLTNGNLALATADQDSDIPSPSGSSIAGSGNSNGIVSLIATGSGTARADSFFDVLFTVDVNTPFTLPYALQSSSAATTAHIELLGGAISFFDSRTNGSVVSSFSGNLVTGVTYNLQAESFTVLSGTGPGVVLTSNGTWQFTLAGPAAAPVPEPATMTLAGIGGAFLLGYARLRRRK